MGSNNNMITADDVAAAMDRGELRLAYLPTVKLADGQCVGAEALVRWGDASAGDFVPVVENTPLSGRLTLWVVDTVAAEVGEWLGAHADAHISINVPPEILGRGGLEYAAVRSGLKARVDQIILEITERGVPDRLGLEALNQMALQGIRLALDDTMLSGVNLALLARCHFSILKLDCALISQLVEGAPAPEWLSGLASLLDYSHLEVVAEGVEREYQAHVLKRAKVQFAQGHLYSKPLAARDFMAFYGAGRASTRRGAP